MEAATALDNPYWDAVCDRIDPAGSLWRTPVIDGLSLYRSAQTGRFDVDRWGKEALHRSDFVRRYSWTVTDPATVAFVAEYSRGRLVDPLAGTGSWAWVLAQVGVDVVAYDKYPPAPDLDDNNWHRNVAAHSTVERGDATDTVTVHADRTLLLAWPPYGDPIGTDTVRAYAGSRVIFIGEGEYGCCGDDGLFALFGTEWAEVADHTPVQWDGMHDVVTVYDRIGGAP